MTRRFFQVLPLLLVFPGVARAAGFDCAAARTAREHLVCADETLSAADDQLNQLYTAALSRLSAQGRRRLREGQLGWSRYVGGLCPITADPAQRADAVSCVSQAYRDRIGDLGLAAVQNGPFLFSRIDYYAVTILKTRADQYDTGLASHHVAYPYIDNPATHQTALWNALVVVKDYPSPFAKDHRGYCDGRDGDTWTGYSLDFATAGLISHTMMFSYYCHGSPHPYGSSVAQTLVLSPRPHPLVPGDLFQSDAPWAERLSTLLLAGVRQAARDKQLTFKESYAGDVAKIARDPLRWSVRKDGLGYQFQTWEIGPHIFQPRVVIPWVDLHDVMVSSFPVP